MKASVLIWLTALIVNMIVAVTLPKASASPWIIENGEHVFVNDSPERGDDDPTGCTEFLQADLKTGLKPVRSFPHEFEGPIEMHPFFPQQGEHLEATVFYLNTRGLRIPIVFPSLTNGPKQWRELFTPLDFDRIAYLVSSMPYKYIHALKELRLNPLPLDPMEDAQGNVVDVLAVANSDLKSIDLSPRWIEVLDENPKEAIHVFGHEFGHILAYLFFASPMPSEAYVEAVRLDGNQISDYGATSLIEDWAEAFGIYFRGPELLREKYPHRAALIDSFFDQ